MEPSDFYCISGIAETVCLDHITDVVLRDRLSSVATASKCSYCPRVVQPGEAPFAIEMDELGECVWEAANWLYEETNDIQYVNGEPWSYDEVYETGDVICDVVERALDIEYSGPITDRLVTATSGPDYWVGSTGPSAIGWAQFARTVRFESRFVFIGSSRRQGVEDEPPARLATFLDGLLAYVESDLLIELPAGSTLYRGRMTDDAFHLREEIDNEPSTRLGSSPPLKAEAGRVSPRGIGMFYAADELSTAVAEIALHSEYDQAVVGWFQNHPGVKGPRLHS